MDPKYATASTSSLPAVGSSRSRLKKALEKAAEVAKETTEALADAPNSAEEPLSANEDIDEDVTQVPVAADYLRLHWQREQLQAKLNAVRLQTRELKNEAFLYRKKEQEFIAELDRHMQGVERNEQELHARIEALSDEQDQLRFHATQQDLEQETLRTQHDEMIAQQQSCESRVQFLMDHLVNLISRTPGSDSIQAMLQTIRADGEERDHQSRLRLELFTRQLEEARQENRIRAQALSDRQCQTTALHERLCKLQNEIFNGARTGLLPTSSSVGPASGASIGGSEVLHVPDSADTMSTATTAATSGGNLGSGQGLTDSTSRLLAKATADLAAVEKLSEPDQASMQTELRSLRLSGLQQRMAQQLSDERCDPVDDIAATETLTELNLSKAVEATTKPHQSNELLMSPQDNATSSERVLLGSYTSMDDADDTAAREIRGEVAEADEGEETIPSGYTNESVQAKETVPHTTVPETHRLDLDDTKFEDSFGFEPVIRTVNNGHKGRHVELLGKGPLMNISNGVVAHDQGPLGVSSPAGALVAAATAHATMTAAANSRSQGSGKERPSTERVERRPPSALQPGATTGTSVSSTAGSGTASAVATDGEIFSSVIPDLDQQWFRNWVTNVSSNAPTASAVATLVMRRTSGPRSNTKIGTNMSPSGGQTGTSSPPTVQIVTAQQQNQRQQSSSIDLPVRSRSACSSSAYRSGSPIVSAISAEPRRVAATALSHSQSIPQVARNRVECSAREQHLPRRASSRRETPRHPQMQSTPVRRFSSTGSARESNSTIPVVSPTASPGASTPSFEPTKKAPDPIRAFSAPPLPSCNSPLPSMTPAVISTVANPHGISPSVVSSRVDGSSTPQVRRLSPSPGLSPTRSRSPTSPHLLPVATVLGGTGSAGCSVDSVAAPVGVPRHGMSHSELTAVPSVHGLSLASPSTSWSATRPIVSPAHQSLVSPRLAQASCSSSASMRGNSPPPVSPGLCSSPSVTVVSSSRAGSLRVRPPHVSSHVLATSGSRRPLGTSATTWANCHDKQRMSSGSPRRSLA